VPLGGDWTRAFVLCAKRAEMRLRILDRGHGRRQRLLLKIMRRVGQTEPDPVVKVCLYRPGLFGRPWAHCAEQVMRSPSEWTAGQREVIAVFVSELNACPFCSGVHAGIADRHDVGIPDPIGQWRRGEVDARMSATFTLLEKVTLTPDAVGAADIARARDAGLSDSAIVDALYVCYFFNAINRIANAFDFGWDTDTDRRKLAKGLDRIGYHVPEFFLH
jgi:uncharacterized peroxidase-related enzyme